MTVDGIEVAYRANGTAMGRTGRTPLAFLVGERRALILDMLRTAKKTTGETAEGASIAVSTASEHLHDLVRAGVIERAREGRYVYYTLTEIGQRLVDDLAPGQES